MLPFCLIQYIFEFSDTKTQLSFLQTCKKFNNKLRFKKIIIRNLHKSTKFNILLLKPQYSELSELINLSGYVISQNIINNFNLRKFVNPYNFVLNIKHMTNLKILNIANSNYKYTDLIGLNLTELDISGTQIANLPHMPNLIKLNISKNLQLSDISHLTTLKKLKCNNYTKIDSRNIQNLKLTHLYIRHNNNFTNIADITTLQVLDCSYNNNITNAQIARLNLRKLYTDFNNSINYINHMSNLRVLQCRGHSAINNYSLIGLKLETIDFYDNYKITNLGKQNKNINILCNHEQYINIIKTFTFN